ncbi:MAG: hypothetical protein HY974_03550 [Candidatus Kerfeldbacteria bacterium]|nr:hypothetical protein [Candidatus Kerfeldbacteria bacterium]
MFDQETKPSAAPVEDIFAGVEQTKAPTPATAPVPTAGEPATPVSLSSLDSSLKAGGPRRWLWLALGLVAALGLLAGGYWWWRQAPSPSLPGDTGGLESEPGSDQPATPPPTAPDVPAALDTDGDGLTDDEERSLATDPLKADTDGDGLFDREEVKVYSTDPLKADTDGDGFSDGTEVQNGYNPKGSGRLLELPKP